MEDTVTQEQLDEMTRVVSSLFADLNIGLFIYFLEDPERPRSLRLVYANPAASAYTRADLSGSIGQSITDAFPGLVGTDMPETFAEVITTHRSQNLGAFEYPGDERVEHAFFSVKAFPMPNRCVGIVFENITVRKRLEELLKKQRDAGAKH